MSVSTFPETLIQERTTVHLQTVKLRELREGSIAEYDKFIEDAKNHGFFYLNLSGKEHIEFQKGVEDIFDMSREIFDLKADHKMLFDVDNLGDKKLNGQVHEKILFMRDNGSSCLHRVTTSPEQRTERYIIAFLMRPENDTVMRTLQGDGEDGELINSGEWIANEIQYTSGEDE